LAYSFLTPQNVFKRYEESKRYTETLTEPFPEFQRIARNRPYEGIDPAYPKTTDGTTASIVQKTPKRVVQQLPTGKVESDDDNAWLPIVAGFIYTNKILPYANEDYGLFEKSHLAIEGGLTFGSAAIFTPFLNHDGYFCPDMTIPYWGDIFLQKGKKSGYACNYVFMRAWWQKEDINALIDGENKRAANAKKSGSTYEPTWDTTALKDVIETATTKDRQAMTPSEEERGVDTSAIELVTAFQKGVGAKFYTFAPGAKKIVRTKVNKDPRGKMPVDWFYGDIDGTNPLGRGIVELIGGLQNLIDSDMQMYQYNRALMLAPPVIKYGGLGDFKYAPNAVIEGTNPQTDQIVPLKIDTTAIANYPQLFQLMQSQLFQLVASPNSTIPSGVGGIESGKTPTALNQQKAAISVDDNAIRKRFESMFENWSETAINLYFAERSGTEILQLDSDTADELRKLPDFQPGDEAQGIQAGELADTLNDKNQLIINYDEATPALKFRVDASTSKLEDNASQLQGLELLAQALDQSPVLAQIMAQYYPDKILTLWNRMTSVSSVENPEDLIIDIDEFKQEQEASRAAQQQAQAQQQAAQAYQPQPTTTQQQPTGDIEPQITQHMQQLGFSPQAIDQALSMSRQGANEQQIAQALGVAHA